MTTPDQVLPLHEPLLPIEFPSDSAARQQQRQRQQCIVAMISNFGTSYNAVNIGLVLPILSTTQLSSSMHNASLLASSTLTGMVVGQLCGGVAGDVLGYRKALQMCMMIQVIASLLSSSTVGDYFLVSIRFLLGIGAGGVYPLAAVLSANHHHHHHHNGQGDGGHEEPSSSIHTVVQTFAMQGVGFMAVPSIGVGLLCCVSTVHQLGWVWRLLLGLGGMPGLVLLGLEFYYWSPLPQPQDEEENFGDEISDAIDTDDFQVDSDGENDSELISHVEPDRASNIAEDDWLETSSWWQTVSSEPDLVRKLMGTATTWFLFDVVFYGNTIFEPIVLETAFGSKSAGDPLQELRWTAASSLAMTLIALPGYFVAGWLIGKKVMGVEQTPRYVMMQGFLCMALLYSGIGWAWQGLRHSHPAILVTLYGLTFFFANYGPNTTTFCLPSITYSPKCRSTLNGASAAAGKIGAALGAVVFSPVAEKYGDATILLACGVIACVGFLLTALFVPSKQTDEWGVEQNTLDPPSEVV